MEVGHCHCRSCRRQTGAPVVTFVAFAADKVRFTGRDRSIHNSSPGVERAFCGQCGTPLTWEGRSSAWDRPIIEFHISTFDDPDALVPTAHAFYPERIAWMDTADSLPRHEGFATDSPVLCHGPAEEGLPGG